MKPKFNKMKLPLFSTLVFTAIIIFSSCTYTSERNVTNDKTVATEKSIENNSSKVNENPQSGSKINLTNFSSIPDSFMGCTSLFAASKSTYNSNNYLYLDDMGTACIISINNEIIRLTQTKNIGEEIEFSNGEYSAILKNKKFIESASKAESSMMSGELVVKDKKGNIITKKVYGVSGC